MMRGLFDFEVIFPKEGPKVTVLLGLLKFGVLVMLKNSVLKWIFCDSTTGIVRSNAMSMLRWPGPRTMPTPLFPKLVSAELVPFGASGAEDRKSTRLNSSHRCISYAV